MGIQPFFSQSTALPPAVSKPLSEVRGEQDCRQNDSLLSASEGVSDGHFYREEEQHWLTPELLGTAGQNVRSFASRQAVVCSGPDVPASPLSWKEGKPPTSQQILSPQARGNEEQIKRWLRAVH